MILPELYYTVVKRSDGFGSQFQYYLWQLLYIELNNGKFIMPKIENMEHNYNNDPKFIENVRKFINLENKYSYLNAIINKLPIFFNFPTTQPLNRKGYNIMYSMI